VVPGRHEKTPRYSDPVRRRRSDGDCLRTHRRRHPTPAVWCRGNSCLRHRRPRWSGRSRPRCGCRGRSRRCGCVGPGYRRSGWSRRCRCVRPWRRCQRRPRRRRGHRAGGRCAGRSRWCGSKRSRCGRAGRPGRGECVRARWERQCRPRWRQLLRAELLRQRRLESPAAENPNHPRRIAWGGLRCRGFRHSHVRPPRCQRLLTRPAGWPTVAKSSSVDLPRHRLAREPRGRRRRIHLQEVP
jgi:hypothetical protein